MNNTSALILLLSILSTAHALPFPVLVRQQQPAKLTPVPVLNPSTSTSPLSAIPPGVSVSPSPTPSLETSPVFSSPNPSSEASAVTPEISPSIGLVTPEPRPTIGIPSSENSTPPSSAAVCFPGAASVELKCGTIKRMSELVIGDVVAVGYGRYSPVFMFTHKTENSNYYGEFIRLILVDGRQLTLTEGHFLYLSGTLRPAGWARVGDTVELKGGLTSRVVSVLKVMDFGLYNPQTLHGDILVNGVRASTFTTAVQPGLAQAALAPFRMVFGKLGISTDIFNSGANVFVK